MMNEMYGLKGLCGEVGAGSIRQAESGRGGSAEHPGCEFHCGSRSSQSQTLVEKGGLVKWGEKGRSVDKPLVCVVYK